MTCSSSKIGSFTRPRSIPEHQCVRRPRILHILCGEGAGVDDGCSMDKLNMVNMDGGRVIFG